MMEIGTKRGKYKNYNYTSLLANPLVWQPNYFFGVILNSHHFIYKLRTRSIKERNKILEQCVEERTASLQREIKDRIRTEEALHQKTTLIKLHQEIAVAANKALTMEDAAQACIDKVCDYMRWPIGHVYLPSENSPTEMLSSSIWHLDDAKKFEEFQNITASYRFSTECWITRYCFSYKKTGLDYTSEKRKGVYSSKSSQTNWHRKWICFSCIVRR